MERITNKMIVRACKLKNWGDSLNRDLVKAIIGEFPIIVNNKFINPKNETIYMVCGSVLGWADSNTIVWGSGFISNSTFITAIKKPKKIYAIRGKLTRNMLLKNKIPCPEVYGDPALLMPKFYNPNITKKYKFSIIPHHIDKKLIPQLKLQFPNFHFIDIQQDTYKFINEVKASNYIISSALHGLICADAYNIPNIWIKLSNNVLGLGFKFLDYFSSTDRKDTEPLLWTNNISINEIKNKLKNWNLSELNINLLWKSCPFKQD